MSQNEKHPNSWRLGFPGPTGSPLCELRFKPCGEAGLPELPASPSISDEQNPWLLRAYSLHVGEVSRTLAFWGFAYYLESRLCVRQKELQAGFR